MADTDLLARLVGAAIEGGAAAVQYRNKAASPALAREQAEALRHVCRAGGVPLIVNDDWRLAVAVGADGVHIGGDDGDPREVRAAIGPEMLLGVSCYDRFELAEAVEGVADQVAFGSVFPSGTKPGAVRAPLDLLGRAKARGWNVVAIGGIDAGNARTAIEAGADAVAVIGGVFSSLDRDRIAMQAGTIATAISTGSRGRAG